MKYKESVWLIKCLLGVGCFIFGLSGNTYAQFAREDSLKGSLNPNRTCYDVYYYDLELRPDIPNRRLSGINTIRFTALRDFIQMQVDLHPNMEIEKIMWRGTQLNFTREASAVTINVPRVIVANTKDEISITYSGQPLIAENPPWDGGLVWTKDTRNKPWIATAVEGIGASVWWPCKDHLSDEPDSMKVSIIVPKGLMAVSNGSLRRVLTLAGDMQRYDWHISYPINNYNVTMNIGNYVHIERTYNNASGTHPLDYYVLKSNVSRAETHFEQVKPMLQCFEHYFGEYPFWKDGYALVETPFWGMEHQSAIAYGNNYENNAYKFDFIIVHESAHEWFGNSLSMPDRADMWIHEAFATYAEALFVEYTMDKTRAIAYLNSQKPLIKNAQPILGPEGIAYDGWDDADRYFKGTWMLHSLRNMVNNDALWFATLKKFTTTYKHKIINTQTAIAFFNQQLGRDYTWFFQYYLEETETPVLEFQYFGSITNGFTIKYRWKARASKFEMPVTVKFKDGTTQRLTPTLEWQSQTFNKLKDTNFEFDMDSGLFVTQGM